MDNELNEKINALCKLSIEVKDNCIKYLTDVLHKNGNKINWRGNEDIQESVTVSYDGGNHPEYASNVYSTVYGVEIDEKGFITLDTEDCGEYEISYVSTMELVDICIFIDTYSEELYLK